MSLLSYNELCELVANGVITDVPEQHINGASIDVRLGDDILVERFNDGYQAVDFSKRQPLQMESVNMAERGFYDLRPGEFILAHTVEMFNLPEDIAAEFKMKSSAARIGLNNVLATWADPHWHGSTLTLELSNVTRYHTIRLRPGDRVGQMLFYRVTPVPHDAGYAARGRYNGDKSVQGIKL